MKYYMFNGLNEENIEEPKKLNKKKVAKFIILIVLIILVAVFFYIYNTNKTYREMFDKYLFRKEVYENNLPSILIDYNDSELGCGYYKYIGILTENVFKIYNKNGHMERSLDIEIANPIFKSNNKYLCIAEKNGHKIYLIDDKTIVWQKEIEGNITNVNVNNNGYISIIVSGTSYKNVIITYDSNGNELFKNYLATTNVIDTDISTDNKYLAIAEANFSGIMVQSIIKIISIEDAQKGKDDSIKYTYMGKSDDLIIDIKYKNKTDLICMYNNHIDVFSNGENKEITDFKDKDVIYADINLKDKIIKVNKKSTGLFNAAAEIKFINNHEKETTYEIDNVPKEVIIQDNIMAINLGTQVLFINNNGWLVKKYESNHEIEKIMLGSDIAGIVLKNKIELVSL